MEDNLDLPPGFRFHPTDEEIITFYLVEKYRSPSFNPMAIGEANLNSSEPWDLPSQAKMGEKEWYFFCKRLKRYPTGSRTNRATKSGYWKATGKDKEIFRKGKPSFVVGMKKTLVFYLGRAPRGKKTNWVMHEFRLEGKFSGYQVPKNSNDEWVVCRVVDKGVNPKAKATSELDGIDPLEDFVSAEDDDGFAYEGDWVNTDGSPTEIINPAIETENQKFPHRSYFYSNDNQPWSSFAGQDFIYPSSHNAGYMNQMGNIRLPFEGRENAMASKAKVEQHSNQSFLSQDTGLSNDLNTEISSVVTKGDVCYPSFSAAPEDGFVSFW